MTLLNIVILLILGGVILLVLAFAFHRDNKITSPQRNMWIITSLLIFVLGVQQLNPSMSIIPANFKSFSKDYQIPFNVYDYEESEEHEDIFKAIIFMGIETPTNESIFIVNYDQANISLEVNLTEVIPNTNTPFWVTEIKIRMIFWNDFVDQYIKSRNIESFELFDSMEELKEWTDVYEEVSGFGRVTLEKNFVKMGTYLVAIYMEIDPAILENQQLYNRPPLFFDVSADITVESVLNFGLEPDTKGYSWIALYISERSHAENLFDDIFGIDVLNILLMFIIVFFIAMLLGLVQRNMDLVKAINIILVAVFMLGLFSVVATGMNNVPDWIVILFGSDNGRYIWGIFEAVKYSVVMGTVLGIIFMMTSYVTTGVEAFFSTAKD
jgi:hypothetical protein